MGSIVPVYFAGVMVAAAVRTSCPPTRLRVGDEAITVEAPAFLRHPLRVGRERVHSVYVFDVDSTRQWSVVADRREDGAAYPSAWWAPDLGTGIRRPRLLVVLDPSMPLTDVVRPRASWMMIFGFFAYTGPTGSTVARGLFFPASDVNQALEAFAGWPLPAHLDPALRTWVEGERVRTRWGWRTVRPSPTVRPSRSSSA